MKHFLVEIIYLAPFEQVSQVTPDHRAFLQKGYDQGLLLLSGPKSSRDGGIVIARAESQAALEAFFEQDPYRLHGIASYRFTEFNPVKRQTFLEPWIDDQAG
ncbi:MAG TPA: YciI family protein [Anaerolineaceae bacterium]|nr:YciI family protein [Anaerolineaceae bacterium]